METKPRYNIKAEQVKPRRTKLRTKEPLKGAVLTTRIYYYPDPGNWLIHILDDESDKVIQEIYARNDLDLITQLSVVTGRIREEGLKNL